MKIVETDHVKLDKGDAVILHMRRRSDPNPFTPGGPFTAQHTIKAGEGGAVDGAQLVRAARAILKEESFEELRLLAPREGEDPQAYASAITVSEDESERFNAYVARDDQGAMHLFMEAQVQP